MSDSVVPPLTRERAILEAANEIAQLLLRNVDWELVVQDVLRILAQASEADRAVLHCQTPLPNNDWMIHVLGEWAADDDEDFTPTSFPLSSTPFGDWMEIYLRGEPIVTPVAQLPPDQRVLYVNSGIKSFASIPIFVNDQLWGDLALNDYYDARPWNSGEVESLKFTGAVFGAAVEYAALQRKLEKSAQLKNFGHLSASISHDFRSILSKISMEADTLEQTAQLSEKDQTFLNRIKIAAATGSELTDQLLTLVANDEDAVAKTEVDMHALLRNNVKLLEPKPSQNIQIRTKLAASKTVISGSAARLQQVVMNLMINAIEAMDENGGGTLTVRTSNTTPLQSPGTATTTYLLVEFDDTGSGMSREVQRQIFDPFFTTKSSGHGLGLSATRRFVLENSGTIAVSSVLGQGTNFTLTFPIID